jgi:hypothetical protein
MVRTVFFGPAGFRAILQGLGLAQLVDCLCLASVHAPFAFGGAVAWPALAFQSALFHARSICAVFLVSVSSSICSEPMWIDA